MEGRKAVVYSERVFPLLKKSHFVRGHPTYLPEDYCC